MMAYVGMFMGGSPGALIAAGKAVLNLQWQAENRQDTQGAKFTVTGPGINQTIAAGTDGRAEILVNVGAYTVSVTHSGAYLGDDPVTVNTESQKAYLVFFDGKVDRSAEINSLDTRVTALDTKLNGLGDASTKDYTTMVSSGNSNLVTSGAVYQAIIDHAGLKGRIVFNERTSMYTRALVGNPRSFSTSTSSGCYIVNPEGKSKISSLDSGGVRLEFGSAVEVYTAREGTYQYTSETCYEVRSLKNYAFNTYMQGTGKIDISGIIRPDGNLICRYERPSHLIMSFRDGVLIDVTLDGVVTKSNRGSESIVIDCIYSIGVGSL